MQCPNQIMTWTRRFEDEVKTDALWNIPKSKRPPRISCATMHNAVRCGADKEDGPRETQAEIFQYVGILAHIAYIRKITYRAGPSAKTAAILHADRAGKEAANSWHSRTKRRVSRLKKAGFAAAVIDDTLFICRDAAGSRYGPPVGTPAGGERTEEGAQEADIFGAVADDGW